MRPQYPRKNRNWSKLVLQIIASKRLRRLVLRKGGHLHLNLWRTQPVHSKRAKKVLRSSPLHCHLRVQCLIFPQSIVRRSTTSVGKTFTDASYVRDMNDQDIKDSSASKKTPLKKEVCGEVIEGLVLKC